MQADRRPAQNPFSPSFRKLKGIAAQLTAARSACGCCQCTGSPMGDIPASEQPCDRAIELAAQAMGWAP